MRHKALLLFTWIAIGIGITPGVAMFAAISAGAGHGNYVLARLFFPYTMLLTLVAGNRITVPLIVLALCQFPIYGAVIGISAQKLWVAIAAGSVILIAHTVATAFCFSGTLPNFS